ncbi:hypothetical protein KAFR_0F01340 [Kazachstania africana CBS 2517]|uniref:HECT-type E3 ubiquitin transferase n=1 Tax=Kazachstania africana (strain ATCC 22294 / BCRC 22015 / CBS 2517 / CECT 1963 / NBRC 1671 / NRRL Y-8276) TaxID=1071382 RepID=H2AWI0_KAZAF|nr:hypothetical protein KAFR_0F01340 [Kazachstania africana CBS 2517]CCF58730.1 hypothetical protein KAFR_0F01340 [Kazachstania africana CBS 2517]
MVAIFRRGKRQDRDTNKVEIISKPSLSKKSEDPVFQARKTLDFEKKFKCLCCNRYLKVSEKLPKFKCGVCHSTLMTQNGESVLSNEKNFKSNGSLICSLSELRKIVNKCYSNLKNSPDTEKSSVFDPVSRYLAEIFHDAATLEESFKPKDNHTLLDYTEVSQFFNLLLSLPTRKPYYRMLCAANDLLKNPGIALIKFKWILILWEVPSIRECLISKPNYGFGSKEIRAVSYELIKRSIGYLANVAGSPNYRSYIYHLKGIPVEKFFNQVETINLYITYQMTKIIHREEKNNLQLSVGKDIYPNTYILEDEMWSSSIDLFKSNTGDKNTALKSSEFFFKPFQYESDWHIVSACKLMAIYYLVNNKREGSKHPSPHKSKLTSSMFYNTMLDFIDYKQDFFNWKAPEMSNQILQIINDQNTKKKFTFCAYPFLLSLGLKISVMQYNIKQIMEYNAEKAFLTSLDKKKAMDVYCRIKVRRSHIAQDSLRCIQSRQADLLKSLRVEFVNEEGIDAGGLKKEWFLLLTKTLFSPIHGLFQYISESRFCWFSIFPISEEPNGLLTNEKLYYLFGVVLGLAIFNGIILDLQFPSAFYKKICNEPLNFSDYYQIYPETAQNLKKMLDYQDDNFCEVFGLTFETTVESMASATQRNDSLSNPGFVTVSLSRNGSSKYVTQANKHNFVDLWVDYYMNKSIKKQFGQFMTGFKQVFASCSSIQLFNSEELERLLCGDKEQNKYDFTLLRSVTKYAGGFQDDSTVVIWFWEVIDQWTKVLQRKVLQFVTGSDRIPATGISALPFKITKCSSRQNEELPVAHTCFNEICLWDYCSKEVLERKLLLAINESQEFALR